MLRKVRNKKMFLCWHIGHALFKFSVRLMLFPVDIFLQFIIVWLVYFRKDDRDHYTFTLGKTAVARKHREVWFLTLVNACWTSSRLKFNTSKIELLNLLLSILLMALAIYLISEATKQNGISYPFSSIFIILSSYH